MFIIKTILDYSFRELNSQYVFVITTAFNEILAENFPMERNANGFLAYIFINHFKGMGLEILTTGNYDVDAKTLKLEKENIMTRVTLPIEAIESMPIVALPSNVPVLENFSSKVKIVDLENACNEKVSATRKVANMDVCRRTYYPDEILVNLIKGEEQIESCLVRVEGIEKYSLYGILLVEPSNDFGVHKGDSISFFNVKNEQGIMCISIFE